MFKIPVCDFNAHLSTVTTTSMIRYAQVPFFYVFFLEFKYLTEKFLFKLSIYILPLGGWVLKKEGLVVWAGFICFGKAAIGEPF
jgi:hypothetical protein